MRWNYENYSKAVVPLALAVGRFFQGWVESGTLNRAELSDVIGLAVVAFLVFLVPNQKKEKRPPKPPAKAKEPNIAETMRGPVRRRRSNDL